MFVAIDVIAAQREGCSPSCSNTIRTARSRTSRENLCVVLLLVASGSHELEPRENPGRFNAPSVHIAVLGSRGVHAAYGGYGKPLEHSAFVMSDDPRYQWLKVAADVAEPGGWTVFDLHRLRGPDAKGLPQGWRLLIDGYDLLVLAPEISPSSRLGDQQK